jgi:hypothetical protein
MTTGIVIAPIGAATGSGWVGDSANGSSSVIVWHPTRITRLAAATSHPFRLHAMSGPPARISDGT